MTILLKIAITLFMAGLPTALISYNIFANRNSEEKENLGDWAGLFGACLVFLAIALFWLDLILKLWSI